MSVHTVSRIAAAAFAVLISVGAQAAGKAAAASSPASGTGVPPLAAADRKFVNEAALGGMAEVELGKLAQQKAASDQVKQFGAKMVEDHSKANEELKRMAGAKNMMLPASLDKVHQKDVDKLGKLSGTDFDRKYTSLMVSDHKKDVRDFEKASKSAKDPEVKGFATKTLPTLQEHLQMAQGASDAMKASK